MMAGKDGRPGNAGRPDAPVSTEKDGGEGSSTTMPAPAVVGWKPATAREVSWADSTDCSAPAKKDGMAKDAMHPAATPTDAMTKGGMTKDVTAKDAMKRDSMTKGAVGKDAVPKDEMKHDAMNKDAMKQ